MYESRKHETFAIPSSARQPYATLFFSQSRTQVGKGTVGKGLSAGEQIFEDRLIVDFKEERITTGEIERRDAEYRARGWQEE